ncbi:MAG: hypothetical protein A2621_04185 [Alphaproteobacteria bacterium RIFCSPHIGHO2_01_FULL_41_14]|nr:MAG: hypothetical protein A2621_04185 [Alphaproteobacteria bacterium RIFCSPHIGHO2_01_FULL_41_14]
MDNLSILPRCFCLIVYPKEEDVKGNLIGFPRHPDAASSRHQGVSEGSREKKSPKDGLLPILL